MFAIFLLNNDVKIEYSWPFDRSLRENPYAAVCPNLKTSKAGISLGANTRIFFQDLNK